MQKSSDFIHSLSKQTQFCIYHGLMESLVRLSWTSKLKTPEPGDGAFRERAQLRVRNGSGWIYKVPGAAVSVLVTAGHVINRLGEDFLSTDREITKCRVLDRGVAMTGDAGVPINLPRVGIASWYQADDDPDWGAILLPTFEANMIAASGKVGWVGADMIAHPEDEFDAYVMLGCPQSAVTVKEDYTEHEFGRLRLRVGMFCVALTRVPDESRTKEDRGRERFCALLDEERRETQNIEGMSGGPIFGLKQVGGEVQFKLIAIQSKWVSEKRKVYAEFAKPFVDVLAREIEADPLWCRAKVSEAAV